MNPMSTETTTFPKVLTASGVGVLIHSLSDFSRNLLITIHRNLIRCKWVFELNVKPEVMLSEQTYKIHKNLPPLEEPSVISTSLQAEKCFFQKISLVSSNLFL